MNRQGSNPGGRGGLSDPCIVVPACSYKLKGFILFGNALELFTWLCIFCVEMMKRSQEFS